MGKSVTLGGDRLGSGNKNKIALRNYERSTHNLSQKWTSSMTCGVLYPCLVIPSMRGDSFEIDLAAAARTIPTQGPLFGSFKMQVDLFQCPVRLYQAILHNNPTAIGLKMNQIKFPVISIASEGVNGDRYANMQFSNSCLMKYLGVSGLGRDAVATGGTTYRSFNAIPLLAYYDIFKNYYSNKQETNAYVIGPSDLLYKQSQLIEIDNSAQGIELYINDYLPITSESTFIFNLRYNEDITQFDPSKFKIKLAADDQLSQEYSLAEILANCDIDFNVHTNGKNVGIYLFSTSTTEPTPETVFEQIISYCSPDDSVQNYITFPPQTQNGEKIKNITLNAFNLKNIDDMRMKLLSHHTMGTPFIICNDNSDNDGEWDRVSGTDQTGLPYAMNIDQTGTTHQKVTYNTEPLNGLVVKTYQSDIYNNWLKTEWIDGENGIAAITAISTAGDSFKIDALNLAEKLYNMLNRIAVSGNTYEDWQDAVYTQSPRRHIESPVYLGGLSSEVVFEEIVQTAPAEGQPLGELGGRGILVKNKGGKVNVKVDEASFIIGIVSLTPRINYSQGNEFYMTDLKTMDDLHKPALDGIGFQNLIGERLAWWDTSIAGSNIANRSVIGKIPAWLEYMTAVDKVYGDMAEETEKGGYMVLKREYEIDPVGHGIKDATTYIDPQKYNYAFAYTDLDSQNFWVQINFDIKARRLMSAKQIPNV